MNLLSKYTFLYIFLIGVNFTHGMELAVQHVSVVAQPVAAQPVSFAQAIMKADMGHGRDLLQQYVETTQDLNVKCEQRGTYPTQDIVVSRFDSDLVTTAICRGARVDFKDKDGNTLLHIIVRCPRVEIRKEYAYFPEQNLLSALAIPTYQYQDVVEVMEGHNEMTEEERALRSLKEVIKTFLLCLKRPEVSMLKDVKFCVLAQLIDATCSPKLFALTVAQMCPARVVEQFPCAWVAQVAERNTGDDGERFAKLYAPLLARYRLIQAEKVLALKNNLEQTSYENACVGVKQLRDVLRSDEKVIREALKMVDALEPEGFVERHKPKCTKIIENMLLGRKPFHDFPEWKVLPVIPAEPMGNAYQE